jgi:hypothetical protein
MVQGGYCFPLHSATKQLRLNCALYPQGQETELCSPVASSAKVVWGSLPHSEHASSSSSENSKVHLAGTELCLFMAFSEEESKEWLSE